jgi:signal transduction histidine kinase
VDDAAVRATGDLSAELLARAAALARGQQRWGSRKADLPRALDAALRKAERRARRIPINLGKDAALDFLGDAVAAVAVEHGFEPGEARATVVAAADLLGVPADAARFLLFRRALSSHECLQLPPVAAAELVVSLLVELAPAAAASVWALDEAGETTCVAAHGKAPRSSGIREVVRVALDGLVPRSGRIRVQLVNRWDRPYAALVARARGAESGYLDPYLAEAAATLAPTLERAADVDRRLEEERETVGPGERHLIRLGFDLHDGPLQEVVLLAEELRLASAQVESVVSDSDKRRVRGRFDDLYARLASLDAGLREIARATSSTTPVTRTVEEALASELQALELAMPIETELDVRGDLDELTDSQKIVLFRVVQEALSNVRKHSGARSVSVVLDSNPRFLDLTISDDGCGFDAGKRAGDRLGLAGIAERVRLLGGVVEVVSVPGRGCSVRATLPQWRPSTPAGRRAVRLARGRHAARVG